MLIAVFRRNSRRMLLLSCCACTMGILSIYGVCAILSRYVNEYRDSLVLQRYHSFQQCMVGVVECGDDLPPLYDLTENCQRSTSWRFRTMLCMPVPRDQVDFSFRTPWTDASYERFRRERPPWLCFSGNSYTSVMAVCGRRTAFEVPERRIGPLRKDLLLIVEVRQTHVHWMEPIDLDLEELEHGRTLDQIKPSSDLEDGFFIGFADGTVWRLRSTIPLKTLLDFAYVDEVPKKSRDEAFKGYILISPPVMAAPKDGEAIWGRTPL